MNTYDSTIERARLIRRNILLVSSTHNLISHWYKHFLLFYGKHSHVLKLFLYSHVCPTSINLHFNLHFFWTGISVRFPP